MAVVADHRLAGGDGVLGLVEGDVQAIARVSAVTLAATGRAL